MLTTAACPEASRKRRPSEEMIQQPSPREAIGNVFLKWRGKSPLLVGMRSPGKDCSRVESRIHAAEGFIPLERLALSPQCGFASTLEGNLLTEADQEAKLRLVAETAREVWGAAGAATSSKVKGKSV